MAAITVLACAAGVQARVSRIVIERHESPAFGGQVFGNGGRYEIVSGRFFGEIDPKDPHNSIITDIQFAPRDARGMVQYSATFSLAKPVDMSKSNGVLYYTVSNRGRGAPTGSEDGRINLLSGWQGEPSRRRAAIRSSANLPPAPRPPSGSLTSPACRRQTAW